MTLYIRHIIHRTIGLLLLLITLGTGAVWGQTNITSLSDITNADGHYVITQDINGGTPVVTTFNGTLEADIDPTTHMPYKITGLSAPLFTTLTGTVKNLVLDNVSISTSSGNTGAIACSAESSARIYNVGILSGSIGGTAYTGGLVGLLKESARVVNCYSFATITGGTNVGGIVGYNNESTASNNLQTMVFACMFYGNITGGSNIAPIYNGKNIVNRDANGVSNFNYFRLEAPYVQSAGITYNCALGAEDRFLQRFEFYRHLLNSHRELAGWWATGTYSSSEMMKWVLEPSQLDGDTPYPVLKEFGKYPSVVNIDAQNATAQTERNKGGKLGTLSVSIRMGSGGAVYEPPTGARITTSSLSLNITDKDPDHYNFNYYKVQLPYYNDVGTNNYTGNRVVTGWKIVSITGGTPGTFTNSGGDVTYDGNGNISAMPFNFADRNCTNKDLYGTGGSNRVFNQGAYWDVPEGVTAITIEPYWAKAAYVADENADVVYNTAMTTLYNVPNVGGGNHYTNGGTYSINGDNQIVYTNIWNNGTLNKNGIDRAVTALNPSTSHTVYDYAVVLVGNYHQYNSINNSKPYTVTSIDIDKDNEPDYSFILRFDSRTQFHPVKYDFVDLVGLGMAQKSTGGTGTFNFGIPQPLNWFEVTNTALFRVTQMEYERDTRAAQPLILHGGVIEQWVSGQNNNNGNRTTYIHVGGNVWFKEFHLGCHQDKTFATKHPPVSVTGGDFDAFYLTGLYAAATNYEDDAECYINGGRFGTMAGTGMEGIGKTSNHTKGNITWIIDNADINDFYAGGINASKINEGNINTIISNSRVNQYCGGPKFGDMNSGRTVTTTATNCEFGTYFGAGYGGNSYYRAAPRNFSDNKDPWTSGQSQFNLNWNSWLKGEIKANSSSGNYANGVVYNGYRQDYISQFGGVSVGYDYQFIPMSDNKTNVARLFIDFIRFSLATTRNVTSTLKHCTITRNFYGGGNLGKVDGTVTSTLDSCTVGGNVFGAGFSASLPTVEVDSIGFRVEPYYYTALGTYRTGVKGSTTTYTWRDTTATVNSTATAIDKSENKHFLYTNEDLTTLGTVKGNVSLTIRGNSVIGTPGDASTGNVYGGGDQSTVYNISTPSNASTIVTIQDETVVWGNVFGGGNQGEVSGNTTVNIQ